MDKLWTLLLNELKILARDKKSLLLLFLMPAILVAALSTILNHLYTHQKPHLKILIVSSKKTIVGEQLQHALSQSQKEVQHSSTLSKEASKNFDVAILIPVKLPELLKGDSASHDKIEFIFYKFLDPFQKTFLMNEFVRLLQSQIIQEINNEIKNQNKQSIIISDPSSLVVESKIEDSRNLPPLTFALSAWSLFAIFFIVIPFSNSFYRDWNNDILLRLKSLNLSKAQVLGARVSAYIVVNFLQFIFLLFLGIVVLPKLLGAELNVNLNSVAPIFLVTLASSLAASAFALFISCTTKSQEQASSAGAFSVVIMSLLGGVMVPTIFMPEFMVKYISPLSPFYWGLEGLAEAFQSNPHFNVLLRAIFILLMFALCFYLLSLSAFRWNKR